MESALAVKQESPRPLLSIDIIKKYICPKATEQEAFMFMQLCAAQNLNPFLKEAYLIKYKDGEPASMVTGKDTFTKRADRIPNYDGFKAGIIVIDNNKTIQYREGSFVAKGETLIGGWAEVYRKDRGHAFRNEVSMEEYAQKKADGTLVRNWKNIPATMIRKVPLVQSLREAFPDEFGGMYSPEEVSSVDVSALPTYEEGKAPAIPIAADAGETNGAPEADQGIATVKIASVTEKDGKGKDDKPYTIFTIVDEAGIKYGTFLKAQAVTASVAKESGKLVKIAYTVGKFGNKITNLELAPEAVS